MKSIKYILLLIVVVLLNIQFVYSANDVPTEISIAVLDGDIFATDHRKIQNYLYEKLNIKVEIKALDYDRFMIDSERGNSDFYKGAPLLYVYSMNKTAILKSVFKNNITNEWEDWYTPIIIARKDANINNIRDLSNSKFYFTNPNSASGYLYPKLFLLKNNIDIQKQFDNDKPYSAIDVYKFVNSGKWDACCSFYGLLEDDRFFKNNPSIKIFEIDKKIPQDPLWVKVDFQKKYPKVVDNIKTHLIEFFNTNQNYHLEEVEDRDYNGIRLQVRILSIIENKDFLSIDRVLGLITHNPKKLEFILKYKLHFIFANIVFIFVIGIVWLIIFKRTIVKKYYIEHKLLNDKYTNLLKHLEEENDFNLKITNIEKQIIEDFSNFKNFIEDSTIIKYIATGEFLYNKYKDTHAMESSAIANCYVKAFERIVMISAYGIEVFEKQDDTKVPDEQQNIHNKLDPKKILDNGIKEVRVKANLSNKEYKSLQKCKSLRNKVAHLKPVTQEEVVSIRTTLLGENNYTSGILAKLAPYFSVKGI